MRGIIAFFTSNWGLKVLALILAIVVYYSMKESPHGGHGKNGSPTLILKGAVDGGK